MADYPLDDKYMVYDLNIRRYKLTQDGFKMGTGVDLGEELNNAEAVNAFLLEITDDVYEFIGAYSTIQAFKYKIFTIAKDPTIREDFKRALIAQGRYALRSSANLLKDMHGVNIEKSKALDLNNLRGHVGISPITINILQRLGLLYQGFEYNFNFDEDGTW